MPINHITDTENEYFKEAAIFFRGFDRAKEYSMEWEYVAEFIQNMKSNPKAGVEKAVWDALYEWDL